MSTPDAPRDLIVIPAYNEEAVLAQTVASLARLPSNFEILIVNDGSNDGTARVANTLGRESHPKIHVVHLPNNGGIGVAVQTGYLFAVKQGHYRYVIQFDADGQHEADALPRMVRHCEEHGLDVCVGSRFLDRGSLGFQSTFLRRVGIRFFSLLINLLSGARVSDPTSGLRCCGPRAWRRFARYYPEDYPEPESLFWCARNHLRIGEIPVHMQERQGGTSSIRSLRPVYYMVKVTLAILLDRLRRKEPA